MDEVDFGRRGWVQYDPMGRHVVPSLLSRHAREQDPPLHITHVIFSGVKNIGYFGRCFLLYAICLVFFFKGFDVHAHQGLYAFTCRGM